MRIGLKAFVAAAFASALILLLLIGPNVDRSPEALAAGDVIPGRYIVALKDGSDAGALAGSLGRANGFKADTIYRHALRGFAANLSDKALRAVRRHADVAYVEPDTVVSIDGLPGQTLPTGIDRINVELNPTADIDGVDTPLDVDIAVIDTGVDTNHPDLRVAGGARFVGLFGCGNGSGSFEDDNGHGSHVSGTAAAIDNNLGVVGVAPGARIWGVKVLNSGGYGSTSCVNAGVDWVTANASTIEVANMSLGGPNQPSLCTAIANSVAAGVTYAVAAGNDGADAVNGSPANCSSAITVSAVADYDGLPGGLGSPTCSDYGPDDTLADFSNFGQVVDIAAPGACIYSTWMGDSYDTISGTSMATPHVAGAAALVKVNRPAWPPNVVKFYLQVTGRQQTSPCGFSGDPDTYPERLLWLGPLASC